MYNIYNKNVEFNNMTYSIDNMRLKTYITYIEFKELEFMIQNLFNENIKKFWISDKKQCFHYNYNLEFETCSFYFGFMHNNENINYNREELKYNFTIDFNPNKVKDNRFVHYVLDKFSNWYLKSLDLAIDIPVNILDIVFDLSNRRRIQSISYGGDDLTYNFGRGDGRIKIYNKKKESNLNIVGYLTRVEISKEFEDFPISNIKNFKFEDSIFPCLYLNQYVFSFSDYTKKDKTLMAVLYAVQSGYPIKDLSRAYKEKLKEMLEGGSRIKFDRKPAEEVLKKIIYYYFVRRESKQIIF